jgi:hypothetical protein
MQPAFAHTPACLLTLLQNFDEAKKELAELLAKAAEEAKKSGEGPPPVEGEKKEDEAEEGSQDPVTSVQKMMKAARGDFGDMERKSESLPFILTTQGYAPSDTSVIGATCVAVDEPGVV